MLSSPVGALVSGTPVVSRTFEEVTAGVVNSAVDSDSMVAAVNSQLEMRRIITRPVNVIYEITELFK